MPVLMLFFVIVFFCFFSYNSSCSVILCEHIRYLCDNVNEEYCMGLQLCEKIIDHDQS